MIVDKKFESPLFCSCGATVETYSVGYGHRPYGIHCHDCGCNLIRIMPSGMGGSIEASIEAWNDYHEAITYLEEKGIKPTENRIRERIYRKIKGWI